MKHFLISAGLLAVSTLPIFAQGVDQTSRINRLENQVAELRIIIDELRQRLSGFMAQKESQQTRSLAIAPPSLPDYKPTSQGTSHSGNYRIKSGDTLWRIAKRLGVSVKALQRSNPRINPKRLRVGSTLNVPGARSTSPKATPQKTQGYRIKRGDTLGHIAQAHGIRLHQLMAVNPGINPRRLHIGKMIAIPGGRSKPRPPAQIPPTVISSPPEPISSPPPVAPIIKEDQPRLIVVEQTRRLSYLAELYNTNVRELNKLNDMDFQPKQMIKAGSELYIPAR